MREVMDAAKQRVAARVRGDLGALDRPPEIVTRSTDDLIERENNVEAFVKRCLERTDDDRHRASLTPNAKYSGTPQRILRLV